MAERFSQKNLRVRPSSDEEKIVTNAKKHFEKTLVEISGELVGSVAALEHPTKNKKLRKNFCIKGCIIADGWFSIFFWAEKNFLHYSRNYLKSNFW